MKEYKIDDETKFDMDPVDTKNLLGQFEEGDSEILKLREGEQFISEEEKSIDRLNKLIRFNK